MQTNISVRVYFILFIGLGLFSLGWMRGDVEAILKFLSFGTLLATIIATSLRSIPKNEILTGVKNYSHHVFSMTLIVLLIVVKIWKKNPCIVDLPCKETSIGFLSLMGAGTLLVFLADYIVCQKFLKKSSVT